MRSAPNPTALMDHSYSVSEITRSSANNQYVTDLLRKSGDPITYPRLFDWRRDGFRNGNWRRLDSGQKALFRCAMWVAKARGKISNSRLMAQVIEIASKLAETVRNAILRAGRKRIVAMRDAYARQGGVFGWAPQVSQWLNDARYVWYLGVLEANP